jgi:hypothetical protein
VSNLALSFYGRFPGWIVEDIWLRDAESSIVEDSGILPPCGLVNSDVSEEHNGFIFRVKQSRDCFILKMKELRLFETSEIISQSTHHNIPSDSIHHEYRFREPQMAEIEIPLSPYQRLNRCNQCPHTLFVYCAF